MWHPMGARDGKLRAYAQRTTGCSEAPQKTIRQPRENRDLKKEFQPEFERQQTLLVD